MHQKNLRFNLDVNIFSFSRGWYLLSLKKEFMDVILFFSGLMIMDMFYIFESFFPYSLLFK
jgi:hypothetical protein